MHISLLQSSVQTVCKKIIEETREKFTLREGNKTLLLYYNRPQKAF